MSIHVLWGLSAIPKDEENYKWQRLTNEDCMGRVDYIVVGSQKREGQQRFVQSSHHVGLLY